MAQLFHRSTNALSKISIAAVVLGGGMLIAFAYTMDRGAYITDVHVVKEQPVPFSHKHHVMDDGIDCRYCHTSVETSATASLPATEICMSCHSQIWTNAEMLEPVRASYRSGESIEWTRVHDLPDFVYFNHSIHVAKGVGCATCHGRVDRMPLTTQVASLHMEWCLECHRYPERYVRPRDKVFVMDWDPSQEGTDQATLGRKLVAEYQIRQDNTSCSVCHR